MVAAEASMDAFAANEGLRAMLRSPRACTLLCPPAIAEALRQWVDNQIGSRFPDRDDFIVRYHDEAVEVLSNPGAAGAAVILMELDTGRGLTPVAAATNAETFAGMASCRPDLPLSFCCPGFDDDPRELPDIPEARAFIGDFARALARLDPDGGIRSRLDSTSLTLIGLCTDTIPRAAVQFTTDADTPHLPFLGSEEAHRARERKLHRRAKAAAASKKGRAPA